MAVTESTVFGIVADKAELARQMQKIDARAGIAPAPAISHEELRAQVRVWMDAQGIRAEDNIGSRDLIRIRYGEDAA